MARIPRPWEAIEFCEKERKRKKERGGRKAVS